MPTLSGSTTQSSAHPANVDTLRPASGAQAIIQQDGEGERRWFAGGGVHIVKASAKDTGGAFHLFEDRMVWGKTTPLHSHPDMDETLILLDGEILVWADGVEHPVGPRGVVVVPRGVMHAFIVTSESATILALATPGSSEAFFQDASEPVGADFDPARPPDWDRLRAAAQRHPDIIQIAGPPPFAVPNG